MSNTPLFASGEKIAKINVADEIKNSFLDYSMSVIISRALPDARDGLKPSQRRILYAMHDLGAVSEPQAPQVRQDRRRHHAAITIRTATQVIYPTLVHMAQPWAMRERLVDGQGNFGSVEGDPPAAMRYTEARLTHLGAALMEDMDQDTVDFVPNYDETRTEPTVFPAAFPNLLVNGGTGIAVGMATNIPPHNLGEIIDGICAQIDDPDITLKDLMKFVKGPDFPTGCMVCGLEGIKEYFTTGRGSVKVRGKVGVEELKGGKEQIIITEIPYNVNRAVLVERIADLVNEKIRFTDITAIRDESDENTRVVIELKRDAIAKVVINNLYKHTALETSFAVNMLAIDHGRPKTLGLKELINCYIEHRREVVIAPHAVRVEARPRNARKSWKATSSRWPTWTNSSASSAVSNNRDEARIKLLAFDWTQKQVERWGILIRNEARLTNGRYALSERQVNAILELRLYQLTGLEIDKVETEYKELLERIKDLLDILAKEARVLAIIKAELKAIKEKYATPRLTDLVPDEGEIAIEDLIANEGVIITLTHNGLIKRTNVSSLSRPAPRRQGRHRHDHPRRRDRRGQGFHRAPVHRQHARLPDVLHEHRAACMSSACTRFPTWAAPPKAAASPTCWN